MNLGVLVFIVAIIAFLAFRGHWVLEQRRQKTGKNSKSDQAHEEAIIPKVYEYPPPHSDPSSEVMDSAEMGEPEPFTAAPGLTKVGGYYFPVPKPGKPTAILVGLSGTVEGREYKIEKEIFQIGASQENDLSIAEDEYTSQNHAFIRYRRGSLFIFDKGSRNGTFVNQNIVSDTDYELRIGDTIHVGVSVFELIKTSKVSHLRQENQTEKIKLPPTQDFYDLGTPRVFHQTEDAVRRQKRTPDEHNQKIQIIRLITVVFISVAILVAAIYVILSNNQSDESKKWAFGAVGTIIGYWLKA